MGASIAERRKAADLCTDYMLVLPVMQRIAAYTIPTKQTLTDNTYVTRVRNTLCQGRVFRRHACNVVLGLWPVRK